MLLSSDNFARNYLNKQPAIASDIQAQDLYDGLWKIAAGFQADLQIGSLG
jgi:hypothetical protein